MSQTLATRISPWPHRWAWLLACATFPLVWWGGFVSATGSGMAFRDWLTSDGVLMPLYPWLTSAGDKFIEHGHRLLGMLAGVLTIAVVIAVWIGEPRRWVRWYGVALLGGVLVQGVLGGMRVVLDERVLALIHGIAGPMFFAACAAMAAVTSRPWLDSSAVDASKSVLDDQPERLASMAKLFRLAALTAILSLLQLVLGAVLRHSPLMLMDAAATIFRIAVYFHLLVACILSIYCLRVAHRCYRSDVCRKAAGWLAILVVTQVLLGLATWLVKYGLPSWVFRLFGELPYANHASNFTSAAIAAGHGAVGSLILALCVVIVLEVARQSGFRSPLRERLAARTVRAAT